MIAHHLDSVTPPAKAVARMYERALDADKAGLVAVRPERIREGAALRARSVDRGLRIRSERHSRESLKDRLRLDVAASGGDRVEGAIRKVNDGRTGGEPRPSAWTDHARMIGR